MQNEEMKQDEFEKMLSGLRPAAGPERDRVMFAAGQAVGVKNCGLRIAD